ncbi:ABC-F type ribosomal protection protein [Ornithinibacillus sp. BX22]|uniref:ABC-F type ribosomal protection protein n=1 Tax=Ornithinibacillus hominis TaxID=2763055 RepID=A0A923L6K2_9BACI|nr:ABC-F type ribosomal protection protein [Ornithinibacillus hominis]MBC5637440.1 ABC-F type ribosomal protection protein [Ornithinibacillus hominis]
MLLLEAQDIIYEVNGKEFLNVQHLQIQHGDCIGVVGKNGSGKTSLVNILTGRELDYQGTIQSEASLELLPQLKHTNTTKSGGEITQQYINKAIAKKPQILFADEPTTNLDKEHIEKLEHQLKRWTGAIVIVSHDRAFLDALCTTIWEVEHCKVTVYPGNYTAYREQKELKIQQQQEEYIQYITRKRQLESALELKKKKAARATKNPKKKNDSDANQMGSSPYYAKKQKKLEKTANAIKTRIEKLEKVEKVKEDPPLNMDIIHEEMLGKKAIVRVEELEGKVGTRLLWSQTSFQLHAGDKVAVIGSNGVGKTTFIKKLLSKENGIEISPSVRVGYFSQNLDILNVEETILKNITTTSSQDETLIRTVLARLHFFRDDVYKQVKVLSGGERVKVAFAKIFLSDINTIVLDEPTNFLDITAVEALESLLREYRGTIIFVSHDRRFIEKVADKIIAIENQEMKLFEGNYNSYINYQPKTLDEKEQDLMIIETKLTDVLSRLSINPDPELEREFQELLNEKKRLSK